VPHRENAPTINDVARMAGVSKRTVSRVINNSEMVNADTRRKVEEIISQLNFAPNAQARGLAARKSYLLGLIYDMPTLFINDIQKGILSVCGDAGYELVVHPCESGSEQLISDVRRFVRRTKVDGVIILPPVSQLDELAEALDEMGCRNVRFTSNLADDPWKLVVTNYVPAITDMTDHIVGLGHRRIGFVSGPKGNIPSTMRQEAFEKALSSHGLELADQMIVEGAFTYESGIEAATELLSLENRPTAVFAANDEMAFGVMNVAARLDLKIPEDLSVVGFDGTVFATFVIPALSTIRRPAAEMSRLGTQKLLALIDEGPDAARDFETMVSPQFVPRGSTGPAPST